MKNIKLTILFVWFSITINAQINDVITFSINDIKIDTIGDYQKLSMPDCSYTDIIGYPELPRLEIRYVIPADKNVSDVIVSDSVVQVLQGEYLLFPHQPSQSIGDTSTCFVQPDSSIYRSNLPYPRKAIEIVEHYNEFGYHIVLLYVYPLVYNPQQQTLGFYSSISYSLSLSNNDNVIQQPKKISERMSKLCKLQLKAIIRNVNTLDNNNGCITEVVEWHDARFSFYPNPAKDLLQLQYSNGTIPVGIELYDLQGRLVHTQRSAFESIDMSQLPAGTYMMRVIMEDGKSYSDKVVKE
jgi:hypothetical protein